MKKFTRIIAAVMAAATIAVTTSVCASARTHVTGDVITEEIVERYATDLKLRNLEADALIVFSWEMGFYPIDERGIIGCIKKYDGAWIDYWATKQKSKVRQEREGYTSVLDKWSTG
ncbi:MAG: hypothetical protein IK093_20505 [Ruminiclostridium sp.]|nr:hypothetical protein [Ruminiclostridium sp.]